MKQAIVLRDALKFAKVKGFKDVCVKNDSKLIIDSILYKRRTPGRLKTIIENNITSTIFFFFLLGSVLS